MLETTSIRLHMSVRARSEVIERRCQRTDTDGLLCTAERMCCWLVVHLSSQGLEGGS